MSHSMKAAITKLAPRLGNMSFDKARVQTVVDFVRGRRLVTADTVNGLVFTVAEAVRDVFPLSGCGQKDAIDSVASGALSRGLLLHLAGVQGVSWMSEGRKDDAPSLTEGCQFGRLKDNSRRALILTDPVECTGEFARSAAYRQRASTVITALAPEGSVPRLDTRARAFKVCLPPGSPVGPDGIHLGTKPADIVNLLRRQFDRTPEEVVVAILDRPWNRAAAADFREAGAVVRLIRAGDFEEHLRAGSPVSPDSRLHVSYGIGGLPEGFLAVPYLRWSGAPMLLSPVPLEAEADFRPEDATQVFDCASMVDSDDCVLAVAGITDVNGAAIVPGVRFDAQTEAVSVSVLVASPLFDDCRQYTVTFPKAVKRLTVASVQPVSGFDEPRNCGERSRQDGEGVEEAAVVCVLRGGECIETRLRETDDRDVEYLGSLVPFGLAGRCDEPQLLAALHRLEERGVVMRTEEVHPFDTCEYKVRWLLLAEADGPEAATLAPAEERGMRNYNAGVVRDHCRSPT